MAKKSIFINEAGYVVGGGSATSGENVTNEITQASHGFAINDFIGWSGGTYNLAIADGTYDGEFIGIVTASADTNTFSVTQSGYVTGLTSGFVANTIYFLSETTAGLLTSTEPTGDGEISKAAFIAETTTGGWVLPYAGAVISTGATSISTANNGLTDNSGIVQLGGDLVQNTLINANGNDLCLTGLPAQSTETNVLYIDITGALASGTTSNIVVDTDLNTGSTNPVQNQAIATVLDQILDVIAVAPTYTSPTASITNVSQTVEMGTTLSSFAVNISFVQNDAGAVNGYELCCNGAQYSTIQNNTLSENNITSTISYVGKVSYDCGITKNNNLGIPDPTGKIVAGTVASAARTITPRLKQFWGGGVDATTSAQVRALTGGNNYSNINSWTANINNTTYVIAIPATKTMTSALTSGNEQIVSNFTSTTFDVDDAGGNPTSYKVYKLDTALPLNLNTVITVS